MNSAIEETKYILNKYNIRANKSLGQNFLINQEVIDTIVNCSEITKKDLVIEIGPGLGTLTKHLLEKAYKVICIELDNKMVNILNDRFKFYENFSILNEDVLKVNLKDLINSEKKDNKIENVKIVANLPYYITTPIIMKLLEEKLDLESITVMIQKEVADRLIAIPGDKETGAITYSVYYYAESIGIMEVPNSSFIPEPEVTSKVIKLSIRDNLPVDVKNDEVMFKVIKCAFMQRRKTLLNSLTNSGIFKNKDQGIECLRKFGLDINIRPEKLSLQDYANIANSIYFF